jgi:hypothetical protein
MIKHERHTQRGAVSIFVVVFCALFVTIITVSFVSLMIRGQQQATNADLSNSAYDAALAGVEDAKRVVLKYRQCASNGFTGSGCAQLRTYFQNPQCNMVRRALTNINDNEETLIKSQSESGPGTNSEQLDQAYTCVEIDYTSEEKVVQVADGKSQLVPIDANGAPYDTVNISWFMKNQSSPAGLTLPNITLTGTTLPTPAQWHTAGATSTTPPIVKAQWIQHGATFSSADFDEDAASGDANVKTLFLYPGNAGTNSTQFSVGDDRTAASTQAKQPVAVECVPANYLNNGGYACSVNLGIPNPKNSGGSRTSYLNLSAFYNSTRVSVKLLNSGSPVEIVAPTIDSTGRANDLFRRVKVGISFNGDYPKAGFDIGGNLCKDFAVTPDRFISGACDPNTPN